MIKMFVAHLLWAVLVGEVAVWRCPGQFASERLSPHRPGSLSDNCLVVSAQALAWPEARVEVETRSRTKDGQIIGCVCLQICIASVEGLGSYGCFPRPLVLSARRQRGRLQTL